MSGKIAAARPMVPIALNPLTGLALGILGVKLTSHWVPPETYGRYALFLTLTTLGTLFTHSGLFNFATRFWQQEREHAGTFLRFLGAESARLTQPLAALLLVICLLLAWLHDTTWLWAFPFLVLGNCALAICAIATGLYNVQERNWMVFLVGAASSLRSLLPLGIALLPGISFSSLATGFGVYALALILLLIVLFRAALRHPSASPEIRARWHQQLWDYGRPYLFLGITGWLLQSVDRWIVILRFGEQQGGLFSMAASLSAVLPNLVTGFLMQWGLPKVFRLSDMATGRDDWLRIAGFCDRLTLTFVGTVIPGLLALSALVPYLVPSLISETYLASTRMILPAGCCMAIVQVNQFHFLVLQGQHNSRGILQVLGLVTAVKTIGGLTAALISWQAYTLWCMVSLVVAMVLGRYCVRRLAFAACPSGTEHTP